MKNIKQLILFALIGVLSFAQAASGQTQADATRESTRLAISPYAQAVPNDSYTFIGVSHPSLDSALTQIGVVVEAIGMTTTINNAAGRAVVFTVDAGETHRVFIVRTNQSVVNSTSISNAQFIVGTTNYEHGHIRVDPVSSNPNDRVGSTNSVGTIGIQSLIGDGYRDITMLSFWGSVVVETNTTGFAMEFIGDMSDSQATDVLDANAQVVGPAAP